MEGVVFDFVTAMNLVGAIDSVAGRIEDFNDYFEQDFADLGKTFSDDTYESLKDELSKISRIGNDIPNQLRSIGKSIAIYADELERVK